MNIENKKMMVEVTIKGISPNIDKFSNNTQYVAEKIFIDMSSAGADLQFATNAVRKAIILGVKKYNEIEALNNL